MARPLIDIAQQKQLKGAPLSALSLAYNKSADLSARSSHACVNWQSAAVWPEWPQRKHVLDDNVLGDNVLDDCNAHAEVVPLLTARG